jgi:hypothetical protein
LSRPKLGMANLKNRVDELLRNDDVAASLKELVNMPARRVINPLFANLYSPDESLKMRTVEAMGVVTACLAETDLEAARNIMRRLMWNLNDESGGIGWGSPEAMGEIIACSDSLAKEYTHVLVSYLREDGNFLEHVVLQRGVLWGLARVAQVRPHLLQKAVKYIVPYASSQDKQMSELAASILHNLRMSSVSPEE